jgi:ABC-type multidrug transport system fused ATPase/permease subunit
MSNNINANVNENIKNIYESASSKPSQGIASKIYDLYGDIGKKYFSKYGGSFFIAIVAVIIIIAIISYINIKSNLNYVKENWNELKCDPRYAPFAGMVMTEEGKGFFEAGTENANYCFNRVLREAADEAMMPYHAIINIYNNLTQKLLNIYNNIRNLLNDVRNKMTAQFEEQYKRLINSVIPIQRMIITIKDIMAKMKGAMITSVYPMLGLYFSLKSAINGIYNVIVKILIGMAATIAVLWIFPFTWGAAASMTAIFMLIMVPMVILSTMMGEIFHLSPKGLPRKPKHRRHCFNGDYIVKTQRGNVPIHKLIPGDKIGNATITSVMKLTAENETMYDLGGGLFVSGSHKILSLDKNTFNEIEDDGRFTPSKNFSDKYIYCLNTTTKIICFDEYIFLDYDELNNYELNKIIKEFKSLFPNHNFDKSNIHNVFDGGFYPSTLIKMKNGKSKPIFKVNVGDELEKGNKVNFKIMK